MLGTAVELLPGGVHLDLVEGHHAGGVGVVLDRFTGRRSACMASRRSVNTGQQVAGSIGTALLNTIAVNTLSDYLTAHGPSPAAQAAAATHS